MAITATQVNELRRETGAGMMACKKALTEADGNTDKAIEILRISGALKAAKRADNATGEGKVVIKIENNRGIIVPVSCETDFVANTDDFQKMATELADHIFAGQNVDEKLTTIISKVGENVKLLETREITGSTLGSYIHSNGKIGVIIALDGGDQNIAKQIAMHTAATNPSWLNPEDTPAELIEKEKPIWAEDLKGKPENIIANILAGKEKKFRAEAALTAQPFAMDSDMTVAEFANKNGAKVTGFIRVQI